VRSYPRAPKATWKVVKACLYITGHHKAEFDTWAKVGRGNFTLDTIKPRGESAHASSA